MKDVLSQVLIIIIMFAYSVSAYTNDKRVKSIYENDQKFKKSLIYIRLTEQILTHDEEISSTIVTDNPIIPITTTPTVVNSVQIVTFGNFEIQKVSETSELSTIKITYTILVFYYKVPVSKVITMSIRVYARNEENNLLPEDVEITCNVIGNETSSGIHSYNCSGETKLEVFGITNATFNEGIKLDGVEIPFTGPGVLIEDDFIANSVNVVDSTNLSLTDGKLTNVLGNTFSIEGTIANFNHNPGDFFAFIFTHFNEDDTKSKVTFNCGPYTEFLNTTLDNVYGTYTGNPGEIITLVMAENSERSLLLNPESSDSLTNSDESSNSTVFNSKITSEDDKSNKVGIIIGIIGGVILVSIIIIVIIYCNCKKKVPPESGDGNTSTPESLNSINTTSYGTQNIKGSEPNSKTSTSN